MMKLLVIPILYSLFSCGSPPQEMQKNRISPGSVDARGRASRLIIREVGVLVGAGAFYLGFESGYLNGGCSS